jgi:hypothetical protein
VAIVIADPVAGLPPTDPLDHEHRVTLPQPLLALGPTHERRGNAAAGILPLRTSARCSRPRER